jgi:hypothetical protein
MVSIIRRTEECFVLIEVTQANSVFLKHVSWDCKRGAIMIGLAAGGAVASTIHFANYLIIRPRVVSALFI